jgi:insertion element IS1 protein InsB
VGVSLSKTPQWQPKDKDTTGLVNLLLLEKIPLAGIARATQVSASWLQGHVNDTYGQVPQAASVVPKAKGKLRVQMDELWSFVDRKGNKQWVWLAMDADTREIIGCHIGDRSRASALALWQSLPPVYRQCAQVYTDYWEAYETVIPSQRHCAVGKESGLTSYIERLNNTLRQRIARLVRKTLSFSKKLENHIGAIWMFIHEYNRLVREKLLERDEPAFSSVLY